MGGVTSRLTRSLKNYNIESRAHKVISKDKPTRAPTYPSTNRQIELVNKLEPNYKTIAATKDPKLDGFLKQVYVRSNSAEVQEIDSRENPNRPLPKDRYLHEGFELGFYVPKETISGKLNLSQALEVLGNHSENPEKYTVEKIATDYKMEPKVVADILEYFKIFHIIEREPTFQADEVKIAKVLSISQRSGITLKHSIKKKIKPKKDEDDDDDDNDRSSDKQISERRKLDRIEGK